MTEARSLRIQGVVQGVGFRPFVYRLARAHDLAGWVLNGEEGVVLHVEGEPAALAAFERELGASPPPAARITAIVSSAARVEGHLDFRIRESAAAGAPTVRISPDLALCDACRAELFDPDDRRHLYPYINCTDCGPRYSIILALPYDRPATTMRDWALCADCATEYADPADRRFHAQPVACPACGPGYRLLVGGVARPGDAIREAARRLAGGEVLAVKGIGGYLLACDARSAAAVAALRERKFRKEKPFAVMARDLEAAASLVELSPQAAGLLGSVARPIVLAPARRELPGVAPGNRDLGVMLPYAPLHELLFAAGAPSALVATSGNRSSEPIAYRDAEALERLDGLADAFLVGERPIARRVDDSVARVGPDGPILLRRARGYAPGAVTRLPGKGPLLALGADLKSAITLVVGGEAFVSQHLGDLEQLDAFEAFRETAEDLLTMYEVESSQLTVVHDLHPEYRSTLFAGALDAERRVGVQHHRAHVASVAAERREWERPLLGVALDGTGYGDDGTIWGGEIFAGSVQSGLERVGHLRPALLPGGDAAARHPAQAAAGFLAALGDDLPDLSAPPFAFPARFGRALQLVHKGVRTFRTTSTGRLFDTAAAICGFTHEMTFEGQAAIWLEHLARAGEEGAAYPFPTRSGELDYLPALRAMLADRAAGVAPATIAAGFHDGLAAGLADLAAGLCAERGITTVALSGGVFQNRRLLEAVRLRLTGAGLEVWSNAAVPANDGGVSLGQAALALAAPGGAAR